MRKILIKLLIVSLFSTINVSNSMDKNSIDKKDPEMMKN